MIVAGPAAESVALDWFKDTSKAKAGSGNNHLATATIALKPQTAASVAADPSLRGLLEGRGGNAGSARKLFALDADDKPTTIVVKRGDNNLKVELVTK